MQCNTYVVRTAIIRISKFENKQELAPEERADDSDQANDCNYQEGDSLETWTVVQINNNECHKTAYHCFAYVPTSC